MISVTPWLFYLYIFNIRNVIGVRIFQNVLPEPMPTKFIEYVPEVISKTCLLKPERGPCRAGIKMFYYEPEIANCTSFKWGGCQGNGNRFDSQEECRHKCLSKQGGPKRRPKWCALTFDYGFCFGAVKRYYFDNLWKVCKTTIYSGCGGNRNNFYNHEQCESVCLYGNGAITLAPKTVTAPTKILIINPTHSRLQERSYNKIRNGKGNGNDHNGGNGNSGNGNGGNGNGGNGNGGNGNGGNGNGGNGNDQRTGDGRHRVDNGDDDDDDVANKGNYIENGKQHNDKNDAGRNENNDAQGNDNNDGNNNGNGIQNANL